MSTSPLQRDKDLEIAAKIGQALLQRNEVLESDLSKVMEQKAMLEQQVFLHFTIHGLASRVKYYLPPL